MDHFGFVEPVDRLCERVVIAVADAADRRLYAGLGRTLGVFDRDVLAASVAVMHKPAAMDGATLMQSLLEGVEHEARMGGPRCSPVDDATRRHRSRRRRIRSLTRPRHR